MRLITLIFLAGLVSGPASSETLALDAGRGLAQLETDLSTKTDLTANDTFSLGAVQFLRAIEQSLQTRYRSNAAVGEEWSPVPLIRLPVEPNPAPVPFRPEVIRELFEDMLLGMTRARATLERADLAPEDKVEVDIAQLWFDVNADGQRGIDESLFYIIAGSLADPRVFDVTPSEQQSSLIVRFDSADVDWLIAYTHFLSAISEVVIAFDPTESITRMIESRGTMARLRGFDKLPFGMLTPDDELWVDAIATIYGALNKVPDQPHLAAAKEHFLGMIKANRGFWDKVAKETDDDREWIPNDRQTAALGFELPPETGVVWLQVLADAEAVLNGELLVSHWRLGPGAGINVAKLVADPPSVDVVTWIQGQGLEPYMEQGQLVSGESYWRFSSMFYGDAMLFMVLLN